jgi:long-chain acyl-CoA synthetase
MDGSASLDITEAFAGKQILFTGATGFVGKVALSMLLDRYGEALERVVVVARRGSSPSAERRFFDRIASSEPFKPLRDARGEKGALEFLRGKCEVLDGDVTDPLIGLGAARLEQLKGKIDVVINCAGLVSFNPSLELGVHVNTLGVRHAVEVCLALQVPLVHVSTAFVAGNRSGPVFEDEEVKGYFPRRDELDGRDFSLERELLDCEKVVARLRERAEDGALISTFRQRALDRLAEEGRDPSDEKTLRLAMGRERKLWLSNELIKAGMERAQHWGWPNTYTYTKSLGEQVIAQTEGLRYAIVRPSVVESALRYPFPGWNEGFTTSAPLCFAGIKGHRFIPAGAKTILDMIPVDLAAGALIAITAAALSRRERRVYQLASGDLNPFIAQRSVELVGLYRRRHFRRKESGSKFWNELLARVEPQAISRQVFETRSAPLFAKGAKLLKEVIAEVKPRWGAPALSARLDQAVEKLDQLEHQASSLSALVELFLPFIWENRYVFRCDNTRSVYQRLSAQDRARIPWDPEAIKWREYFLQVHLPGLEKWVFPGLEEETKKRTAIPVHRDLIELFEASVHAHRHRVALRMVQGEREERFTYGEVDRYSGRVASFLIRSGVGPGDRVLLISENRPEWAMSYFGTLRAGASAVPVDPELSEPEVVNLAQKAKAVACLISERSAHSLSGLFRAFAEAGLQTQVHSLAQAMEGDAAFPDRIGPVKKSASPEQVASLIFTSGTTGNPKGVILTHRNFASLVAKLSGAFPLRSGDALLSVLPLHHTFEFSCGFLMPFSRGAEITYVDELTADRLGEVFETGRITAMVGVPALWQLLHRKITQELTARPALVEQGIRALLSAHSELRNRTAFNLGKILFWPVHRKFGGRLKFLVSGGSALPEEIAKAFHSLGFNLSEGYGLTEAAPVLTVSAEGNKKPTGTVGKALPGIELKIDEPDGEGIGEVLARGPNVMAGYFEDRDATDAVLQDGWLHTGDLGRLDSEGNLFLVGRKKEVIIDASGRNVYPDELEAVYADHPHIKELSIVGLPDETGGEKVACLCVPDYGDRTREEIRREIEEHFHKKSAEMPFYRRVKVLRIWDGELPRTSTRKIRRRLVVEELKRLERIAASGERAKQAAVGSSPGGIEAWLYPLMAEVLQRPAVEIRPEARLTADLGFDSLMLTELSVVLEDAGVSLPAVEDLTQLNTVGDLQQLIAAGWRGMAPAPRRWSRGRGQGRRRGRAERGGRSKPQKEAAPGEAAPSKEIAVPEAVASVGRSLLSFGQKVLYGGVFDVQVKGKNFIPQNRNFLVISNHTSHLDMGLIKVVLGEQGERLTALAARDYFFDTPLKRAYFENFTNLIPMDRHGSLRESLRLAGEALNQGYNLLIFPEGTRSATGQLLEFKPTIGYLALTYEVDLLPLYLTGTYEALPKGSIFPKGKDLKVQIGPPLMYAELQARTKGLARSESYRQVTHLAEEAVKALRDGKTFTLQPESKKPAERTQRRPLPLGEGGGEGRSLGRKRR